MQRSMHSLLFYTPDQPVQCLVIVHHYHLTWLMNDQTIMSLSVLHLYQQNKTLIFWGYWIKGTKFGRTVWTYLILTHLQIGWSCALRRHFFEDSRHRYKIHHTVCFQIEQLGNRNRTGYFLIFQSYSGALTARKILILSSIILPFFSHNFLQTTNWPRLSHWFFYPTKSFLTSFHRKSNANNSYLKLIISTSFSVHLSECRFKYFYLEIEWMWYNDLLGDNSQALKEYRQPYHPLLALSIR